MTELFLKDEVYYIVGAAMEVYNERSFGFSEPVYQECMEIELESRNIFFISQGEIALFYKRT